MSLVRGRWHNMEVDEPLEMRDGSVSVADDITKSKYDISDLQRRVDLAEQTNTEQEIRLDYLEGRQYAGSDNYIELFLDKNNIPNNYENAYNAPSEIMCDNDWNNNWKYCQESRPEFKNGFMRQQSQHYMFEVIDEFNLVGIGLAYKGGIAYDQVNSCYWLLTAAGGSGNSQGCITKLSTIMKNNTVEVLGNWYLPAMGASHFWGQIGCADDGTKIWIGDIFTGSNKIYGIAINTDGTLGRGHVKNGQTIHLAYSTGTSFATADLTLNSTTVNIDSTVDVRVGSYISAASGFIPAGAYVVSITNATSFVISAQATGNSTNTTITLWDHYGVYNDTTASANIGGIVDYNTDDLGYLLKTTTAVSMKFLNKSTMAVGATTTITGFGDFVAGTDIGGRPMCKSGSDIYIKCNDTTDNKYYIYKFNITSDISSNVVVKSSGRFDSNRKVDRDYEEGICVSAEGDILEMHSTASNGRFLSRRAVKNALWAENLVAGEIKLTDAGTDDSRLLCFDGVYIWYCANNANTNLVRLYRRNLTTGAETYLTLNAGGWGYVNTMCIVSVSGTDYFYILGCNLAASTYYSRSITRATVEAALGGNLDVGTAGTSFTGFESAKIHHGICTDGSYVYVVCDTDDAIDRWTLAATPVKDTDNYITLWPAGLYWGNIAYKNSKFYLINLMSARCYIHVLKSIPVSGLASGKTAYQLHNYSDPSINNSTSSFTCCFNNNDFWVGQFNVMRSYQIKILDDPTVLQMNLFLNTSNVLPSDYISHVSPIVERYFSPEEFTDIRDCPDSTYCVVCSARVGFSVLHLDEYLNEKSSSGLDRRSPDKIRAWHFKMPSTAGQYNVAGEQSTGVTRYFYYHQSVIERDMIITCMFNYTSDASTYTHPSVLIVDLKSGKVTGLNYAGGRFATRVSGYQYRGSLSERNDYKGYSGTPNPELDFNVDYSGSKQINSISSRTFTKDDPSDYKGENPVTFAVFGSSEGAELLRIDWDSNNNRTPVKVWGALSVTTSLGRYSNFIAPSGLMFFSIDATTGNLYKSLIPVWLVDADNNDSYIIQVGSGIVGGASRQIAPNSHCWKTPSGTWRHQLYIAGSRVGGSGYRRAIMVDIENSTSELISQYSGIAESYAAHFFDIYEDKVFFFTWYNVSGYKFGELTIHKKLRFDDGCVPEFQGSWSAIFCCNANVPLAATYRPYWSYEPTEYAMTINVTPFIVYSPIASTLFYGNEMGIHGLIFPKKSESTFETNPMETSFNPSKIHYNETVLTPYGD